MPELHEEIISIICEEWPDGDDELNQVTIHERLEAAGVAATEDDVQQVLLQLSDHRNITLAVEPGGTGGLAVADVHPDLCP